MTRLNRQAHRTNVLSRYRNRLIKTLSRTIKLSRFDFTFMENVQFCTVCRAVIPRDESPTAGIMKEDGRGTCEMGNSSNSGTRIQISAGCDRRWEPQSSAKCLCLLSRNSSPGCQIEHTLSAQRFTRVLFYHVGVHCLDADQRSDIHSRQGQRECIFDGPERRHCLQICPKSQIPLSLSADLVQTCCVKTPESRLRR